MNRGSDSSIRLVGAAGFASMRPRFMNRGSNRDNRNRRHQRWRFNEAPIHESGKSRGRNFRGHCDYGFNEAPIHESGK